MRAKPTGCDKLKLKVSSHNITYHRNLESPSALLFEFSLASCTLLRMQLAPYHGVQSHNRVHSPSATLAVPLSGATAS